MKASREYTSHEIDVSKHLDATFHFSRIHLMSHWVEQIRQYGPFQRYSAARHEHAHKTNLKDNCTASKHNFNYLPQVITYQRRIICFEIRVLNLQAPAQHWEIGAAACEVPRSGAALAAPLSRQSCAKPEFMGPHNCPDRKHADTMFKLF
jgi:hypothetical protein